MSDQQNTQHTIDLIRALIGDGVITKDQVVELTGADGIPPEAGPIDVLMDMDRKGNWTIKTTPEILEHIRALFSEGDA